MYNKAGEAYYKLLWQNLLDQSWHMIEIIMSSVLLNFSEEWAPDDSKWTTTTQAIISFKWQLRG